jgi:hypothetical protein
MGAPSSDSAAIRQVIRALRKADHVITGGNDGEEDFTATPDESEDSLIANLTACDSSSLYVQLPDGSGSFVYFVLGNDPEEVVCDHGTSLEPVLDPLTASWWS